MLAGCAPLPQQDTLKSVSRECVLKRQPSVGSTCTLSRQNSIESDWSDTKDWSEIAPIQELQESQPSSIGENQPDAPVCWAQKRFAIRMHEDLDDCSPSTATGTNTVLHQPLVEEHEEATRASLARKRFEIRTCAMDSNGLTSPVLPKARIDSVEGLPSCSIETGEIRASLAQKRFAIRMHDEQSFESENSRERVNPQQGGTGRQLSEKLAQTVATPTSRCADEECTRQSLAQKRFDIRMFGEMNSCPVSAPEPQSEQPASTGDTVSKVSFAQKRFALRMHNGADVEFPAENIQPRTSDSHKVDGLQSYTTVPTTFPRMKFAGRMHEFEEAYF